MKIIFNITIQTVSIAMSSNYRKWIFYETSHVS